MAVSSILERPASANTEVEFVYDYGMPSTWTVAGSAGRLFLSTSGGVDANRAPVTHPYVCSAQLRSPQATAVALGALAKIAAAKFTVSPAELRALRDPVVTSGSGVLRFEVFSGCSGLYARLDLPPPALAVDHMEHGTTNVDFNPQLLGLLARVTERDRVQVSVGHTELLVERGPEAAREREVTLPTRWGRGFGEAAAIQSRMTPVMQLGRAQAMRLVASLPVGSPQNTVSWLVPAAGGGARFGRSAHPEGVRLHGVRRLGLLRPLARYVQGLAVYRESAFGEISAWQFDLGGPRVTVVVSPDLYRGFSGEGQLLEALASGVPGSVLTAVDDKLCWQRGLRPSDIDAVSEEQARDALFALGARGVVGYDAADGGFFHRDLPFPGRGLGSPRLEQARELARGGAVHWLQAVKQADVHSRNYVYRVQLDATPPRCTCKWSAQHGGTRGPCKHVLAARMALVASRQYE